jgi:hypothetical protein
LDTIGEREVPGVSLFQHLMHALVQADVLMWPPSMQRSTYNSDSESMTWAAVEASVIYDMDHIQQFAKRAPQRLSVCPVMLLAATLLRFFG